MHISRMRRGVCLAKINKINALHLIKIMQSSLNRNKKSHWSRVWRKLRFIILTLQTRIHKSRQRGARFGHGYLHQSECLKRTSATFSGSVVFFRVLLARLSSVHQRNVHTNQRNRNRKKEAVHADFRHDAKFSTIMVKILDMVYFIRQAA